MKCPGQDSRFWKQDAIYEARCPECDQAVEFFKDDTSRRCPYCGHRFVNPEMDFGCAAYCQFAEQCLGDLPEDIKDKQQELIKDKVGMEVRQLLMHQPRSLQKAQIITRYAERLGKDTGGDMGVILMAAHLLSIPEEARTQPANTDQSDVQDQNLRSKPEAILDKVGADSQVVNRVMSIVRDLFQTDADSSLEAQVVHDARVLADLEQECGDQALDTQDIEHRIQTELLTEQSRSLARRVLLGSGF